MRTLPVMALLAGCTEQEFNIHNNPLPAGDLTIEGRVCHPITKVWLEDALVYTHLYDDNDVVYDSRSDTTDADGFYLLEDLVGGKDYEIYVQVGHDIIDKFIVGLGDGDLQLPPPVCAGDVTLKVAVVTGAYDELAPVLEAIGVTGVDVIDGQVSSEITDLLTDPAVMSGYDMILFDGGHREDGVVYGTGPIQAVLDNLRGYVDQGGVVFASDWAYDVIELAWPDKIEFFGDDTVPDDAQVGETGTITADVVDPTLAGTIQSDTVDITYDLSVWPLVESTDGSVTVYLQGDAAWREGLASGTVADAPLLVSFDDGAGRVLLTTYRNSANNTEAMLGVLIALVDGIAPTTTTSGN